MADDKLHVVLLMFSIFDGVENIVGKEVNTDYQPSPYAFNRLLTQTKLYPVAQW